MNFDQLVRLFQQTHGRLLTEAERFISSALAARNWLFGWYIIEFEQNGEDRAAYGAATLKSLATALRTRLGRGFSVDSLEQMRRFYLSYPSLTEPWMNSGGFNRLFEQASISGTVSRISFPTNEMATTPVSVGVGCADAMTLGAWLRRFTLGWSHYVELLTLDDPAERHFYEIEATANQWSVRELRRQIDASLYERLALSRDKDEIRRLATEGQVVEKAADLIKNPLRLQIPALSAVKRRTQGAAGNDHPGTRTQCSRSHEERRGPAMNAQSLTISLRVSAPPREGLLWRALWT